MTGFAAGDRVRGEPGARRILQTAPACMALA